MCFVRTNYICKSEKKNIYIKNNGKLNYDGCIYLTDGYASEPKIKCRIKLLWVVTSDIDTSHLINGKIIKLNINDWKFSRIR